MLLIIFPILIVMATSEEVGTDWTRSAGDMSCTGPCQRKRLPASEFSESQVKRALEWLRKSMPDRDIREGVERHTYVSAKCKQCVALEEQAEQEARQAKIESGEVKVSEKEAQKLAELHKCWQCNKELPGTAFSRKMLTKPPNKRRCSSCAESAVAAEAAKQAEKKQTAAEAAVAPKGSGVLAEVKALCADAATEATKVTGIQAKPAGSKGGGRGWGGRGYR